MDEAGPLVRAKAQRVKQPVEMALGAAAALDGETGRLVQHDHGVVAMQYRVAQHRFVAGRGLPHRLGRRRRHLVEPRKADRLPRHDPVARTGALAVDPNAPGAQQLFEMSVSQGGVMALEPAIDPNRAVLAGDGYGVSDVRRHSDAAARWRSLSQ